MKPQSVKDEDMNISNDERERRRFHRILFDAPAKVVTDNDELITTLADISLNGALLVRPDDWVTEIGSEVELAILLDDAGTAIRMDSVVAHIAQDSIGLRCRSIDMESISHLRRLVELNLGDPALLERELEALG